MTESFDAVYYPLSVPTSFETLTYLALIFDKVHFPNVYIPDSGIDEVETKEEIDRIQSLEKTDIEHVVLINLMKYSLYNKYLKDFCVFTGKFNYPAINNEEGTDELVHELYDLIYGSPSPNFIVLLDIFGTTI